VFRKAVWATCVTYIVVAASSFFYRSVSYSRLFVVFSMTALFLLAVLTHHVFGTVLSRMRHRGKFSIRVLMVGADQFANRAAETLARGLVLPYTIVGYVRLPGQKATAASSPLVELDQVEELAWEFEIDDVVIALPPGQLGELPSVLGKLERLAVPVRAVLDLGEGVLIREAFFDVGGLPMLDLRVTPSESATYLVLKRSFDLLFAAVAVVLTAPLMVLIAIVIRLTSPGPVFFGQDRVGLNGRIFRMYKFRTMRVSDQHESETRWTTQDDPRRTRLGAWLRRTNLDELPQFLNVLKGDMSVVGPRPERSHFARNFMQNVARYNTRHYLKVGITGWAQVNGWRGDTSIARRVEYDFYYLRNWSLLFDLKIILMTVWRTIVANRNAY
jgi:Undecaprenyl-phosphate glucose phosphotransferase